MIWGFSETGLGIFLWALADFFLSFLMFNIGL